MLLSALLGLLLGVRPLAPCALPAMSSSTPASRNAVRAEIRKVVAELGGSERLAQYLIIVATRESSLRPGVIHVGDDAHAAAAYRRLRERHIASGSPFALRPGAWRSLGLFGQNANYYELSDPRVLCTTNGAVTAYVIKARSVVARMRSCVASPTWGDLHRAMQRGVLCPDGRGESLPAGVASARMRPGELE